MKIDAAGNTTSSSSTSIAPGLPGRYGRTAMAVLGILCAMGADAQTRRCDLVGRDSTMDGNPAPFKRCLDLAGLDGKTVLVPSNVTRIDNDGLSLCKGSVQTGGDVDLVYIYDNSGSMLSELAYVNTATNDTSFYYRTDGCSNTSRRSDSATFLSWNSAGTALESRTIPRLVSNAGCTERAGDPYNTRGRAFRLGITDQGARAPLSSAGILSFTNSAGNIRRPRVLNSQTNIDQIRNGIYAVSNGGTTYGPPLDTAKKWLTGPLTTNPKKAIIFLSDGKPTDTNYPSLLPGMPPIYGIFLGSPRPDTLPLSEMSRLTGGKFYLIPPSNPDSLRSVVAAILNIILMEYEPQSATVTNASLTPAQSATSAPADFTRQPDGSWLMRLSDVIGLRGSATNAITVATTFKEKVSGAMETKTVSFTLNTNQTPATSTQQWGSTQFGVACYDKSALSILNAANTRPAWFTDTNTAYQVRIRTTPSPLDSLLAASATGIKSDSESPRLKGKTATADSLVFRNPFAFLVSSGASHTDGNGTLEANLYDSIVATWVHPRDAQDVARDVMPVRARPAAATVRFSRTNGGAATTQYPLDATRAFIIVQDQAADPRRSYTAVVTAEKFGLDREVISLAESPAGSGILMGSLPFNLLAAKNPGNDELEISNGGDQLRVVYKDAVDGDSATATAGFDENVQEAATLEFTDASGIPLPAGAIWSPANGKLHFRYSDDYAYGRVETKPVSLTLTNSKYGAAIGADRERIDLDLVTESAGTRGFWRGSIDLADAFPALDSNGKAEARFRGEAAILANAHDNIGSQQAATVAASLIIAYPDIQATITWKMDTAVTVDEGMVFTVHDQTFTGNRKDTALVTVGCLLSGDSVSGIWALESPSETSGIYVSRTLEKNEVVPSLADRSLSCLTTDRIRVRYRDPVYGTLTELIIEETAKPVATPAGRPFVFNETVVLTTATPGAIIHYTTDGSAPIPGVSPVYAGPIRVSVTTSIKAIAVKPGFKDSKVLIQNFTKVFTASRLEILDENGNTIPGGILTGASKSVRIKLITSQDNLSGVAAGTRTKVSGDADTVTLGHAGLLPNAMEYWQQVSLVHPSAKIPGNDTIEATGIDTLIATWVNPFNSADAVSDTLIVKPAFVVAQVYFSGSHNGPRITEYPVNTDSVYIVVKTRPRDPALSYSVTVTSTELGLDRLVLNLTESAPGVFTARAPVGSGAKNQTDGIIQVAIAGDQLTAVFRDPVYMDDYSGNAGFAQGVQEAANLRFLDETGTPITPGTFWNPAKGKVYVRYSDDWNPGIASLVSNKAVRFDLTNRKSGASVGADSETLVLALKDSSHATRGVWEGSLDLEDKSPATSGNDILESYFRGELRASVSPHDNAGQAAGADAIDSLLIAYPNQPADIAIRDDADGSAVDRAASKVDISIRDQLFSTSGEVSVSAKAACAMSGDEVSDVLLVWDGEAYSVRNPLVKGETSGTSVDKNDAALHCQDGDRLIVTYVDPVYLDVRTAEAVWKDETVPRMHYASAKDSTAVTSVAEAAAGNFLIIVEGKSPSRDRVDTIRVVLTTAQGEKTRLDAVETGAFTGRFIVKADFRFSSAAPDTGDRILDARIDPGQRVNQVLVNGAADVAGASATADLSLVSAYNMVVRAYMKDEDGNGRADHAYFVFDHKATLLPAGLAEVYWNEEGSGFMRKAEASMLSFLPGTDSTVMAADFSANQFGAYLTGVPAGKNPVAVFPDDNLFGGQKPVLGDSVGPVAVAALKRPSNLQSYAVTETERRFNPDTLVITVSEKLKTSTSFDDLLRFSKGCSDYGESNPVRLFSPPSVSADGLSWIAIVDNAADAQGPLVGDCIFLEADGRYTDMKDNRPSRLGAPLTGENPRLVIRAFRGYPPVAGLDANTPGFLVTTNDRRGDDAGVFSQPTGPGNTWEVTWIPPYGFKANDPVGSVEKVAKDFNNSQSGTRRAEIAGPQPMPTDISTVQVIASGAYKAQIRIFDNFGNFVRYMEQSFGTNGEDKNPWRATEKGQVSFLVWDMKDKNQVKVGQGVYVWKVSFVFVDKSKKSEVMYTRTGILR